MSSAHRASAASGQANMQLCEAGHIALRAFGHGLSVVVLTFVQLFGILTMSNWWFPLGTVYVFLLNCYQYLKHRLLNPRRIGYSDYPIVWRASMLGSVCGMSLLLIFFGSSNTTAVGLYGIILSTFHFSEYLTTSFINARFLNIDSFLLNHSREYHIAMLASWIEFSIEYYFWPDWKKPGLIAYTGLGLCAGGEVLRKCAMLTAGSNFHHLVRTKREEDHRLITTGVYSVCRHPSYAGWFLWSVGTQLILFNPFCMVAYALATWMFFRERVEEEEIALLGFFGEEYADYQNHVVTGLPFIGGFSKDL